MAGPVKIADVIVPEIFTPYVQQYTTEKSRIIQSGIAPVNEVINDLLAGGGLTFNVPSFKDVANDEENVSTDNDGSESTAQKIGTAQEIAVRMNRNQSWSSMDLVSQLIAKDPMAAIGDRVGAYWVRRLQVAFVAVVTGLFADNAAAASGTDTHTQNDMTVDISGGSFVDGVTNFSAEAFIDAATTMGDSAEELKTLMVHSVVFARMQKNNLIDFVPDSEGKVVIPTFLGREVIVDDGMPVSSGVYHSWLFGGGAFSSGQGTPKVPTETLREPKKGTGAGMDTLFSRVEWCLHPAGHAYIGTAPSGGPSNAATTHNLAAAGSWSRVWPERKMIKIARLITREA